MQDWSVSLMRGLRLGGVVLCALAVSAAMASTAAYAWVPGRNGDIAYTSDEGGSGYFVGSPHVWLISPDGTNKRELTNGNDAWPAWSPNGRKIVFARQTPEADSQAPSGQTFEWRIWEMNADGSHQVPLTPAGAPGSSPNRGDNMPRFSPDGSRIVFIRTIPNPDPSQPPDAQIWLMDADGGNRHALTDLAPTHIYAVGWSPDGQKIVFLADDLYRQCRQSSGAPCRQFYEISPAGSAPVSGSVEGLAESFDFAPGLLAWGDTVFGNAFGIFVSSSTSGTATETSLEGDHPSWAPDAATTHDIAFATCFGDVDGHCSYQLQVGSVHGSSSSRQQLTFDSSDHYSPSWGPTAPHFLLGTHVLSVALPPQLGKPTVPLLIHCPGGAGQSGCQGQLTLTTGSTGPHMELFTFSARAGTDRIINLRVPHGTGAGTQLSIRLTLRFRGHKKVARVRSRVLRPATLTAGCPAHSVPVGSRVTISGRLNDNAPAGRHIGLVAFSPDGQAVFLKATTSQTGSYSAALSAYAPGRWEVQTVWRGDANHPYTSSGTCPLVVRYPPPAKTELSISCPGKASVKQHLEITGALKPPFPGAQITVRYSYSNTGQKSTVITASDGTFSDNSVAANQAGTWDVTAFYLGDAAHKASTSQTCAIAVS